MEPQLSEGIQKERDAETDRLIAAYKRDVDLGRLRDIYRCTVEERLIRLMQLQTFFAEMRAAGQRMRNAEAITEQIESSTSQSDDDTED